MKVLDLRCSQGHGFEGWFASEADFRAQVDASRLACPLCEDTQVTRLPSAPRLNLSVRRDEPPRKDDHLCAQVQRQSAPHESSPSTAEAGDGARSQAEGSESSARSSASLQALWLAAVHHVLEHTEDVGPQFAEQARRIHYGEAPERGIRGQVTDDERSALNEEGIETLAIPVPAFLKGPMQ